VAVAAYNLGYLPGYFPSRSNSNMGSSSAPSAATSDNSSRLITTAASTAASITRVLPLIRKGGLMTIISYRAHHGGEAEYEAVQKVLAELDPDVWRVTSTTNFVVKDSPVLFTAYRRDRASRVNPVKTQ